MNFLLDTCALIWLVNGADEFSDRAKLACMGDTVRLYVSAATAWEIALKHSRGKLSLLILMADWWKRSLVQHGLFELPMTAEIAIASTLLPPLHSDPADRLLIATAKQHQLTLLTPDVTVAKYPGLVTLW